MRLTGKWVRHRFSHILGIAIAAACRRWRVGLTDQHARTTLHTPHGTWNRAPILFPCRLSGHNTPASPRNDSHQSLQRRIYFAKVVVCAQPNISATARSHKSAFKHTHTRTSNTCAAEGGRKTHLAPQNWAAPNAAEALYGDAIGVPCYIRPAPQSEYRQSPPITWPNRVLRADSKLEHEGARQDYRTPAALFHLAFPLRARHTQ
jgi:hypothetical protein